MSDRPELLPNPAILLTPAADFQLMSAGGSRYTEG